MSDQLEKSLGLSPLSQDAIQQYDMTNVTPIKNIPTQEEQDFDYARTNLKVVIDSGQEALQQLIDIADQSQHPRAYEVIANLVNTLASANKDLLDLSKKKKELLKNAEGGPQTINNNLILTTADLQKLLSGKKDD
jgi:hypothetical protein